MYANVSRCRWMCGNVGACRHMWDMWGMGSHGNMCNTVGSKRGEQKETQKEVQKDNRKEMKISNHLIIQSMRERE